MKKIYEILVPTICNGNPVRIKHHKVWDKKILTITKGLTIFPPSKGYWVSPTDVLFEERMIPVRIMCEESDIDKICDITAKHYNQEAIMYYLISNEVIIKSYK